MSREENEWRPSIGARVVEDGVLFRVWAPASRGVEVVLYDGGESFHPLAREDDGYFSGVVPVARPGSRYRYRLDGGQAYPDPASGSQPDGVHGSSEVIDPSAFRWRSVSPEVSPERLVIYELHVGAFTPEGTFDAAITRFDDLARLGITAIEPMPIAGFPGTRNWGYDGVNLFAPAAVYGGPDGFRRFVDAAHQRGLAVILDVVYNHFGPEGNFIPAVTGGRYFTDRHKTPWGDGINYDGPDSRPIRDFVIDNALHWLVEYRVDGLRLDATHAIIDDSEKHILQELAERLAEIPGPRRILIAEDERNDRSLLTPLQQGGYGIDAVWADDLHHQLRRMTAGDSEGYFEHYSGSAEDVASTLARGWWRNGEGATELTPSRFVHCLQNHDQVGNRALGERLNHQISPSSYRALTALLLTSPYIPLLWMGQEWASSSPFLYFTDHPEELGRQVTSGRREEFARFTMFSDPAAAASIPDPQALDTFTRSGLIWAERDEPPHAGILSLYAELLALRAAHPALLEHSRESLSVEAVGEGALVMRRTPREGPALLIVVNLRGEIILDLAEKPGTRPREGRSWSYLLSTEEIRFAGDGGWGRLEADGILHLVEPAGVILVEAEG